MSGGLRRWRRAFRGISHWSAADDGVDDTRASPRRGCRGSRPGAAPRGPQAGQGDARNGGPRAHVIGVALDDGAEAPRRPGGWTQPAGACRCRLLARPTSAGPHAHGGARRLRVHLLRPSLPLAQRAHCRHHRAGDCSPTTRSRMLAPAADNGTWGIGIVKPAHRHRQYARHRAISEGVGARRAQLPPGRTLARRRADQRCRSDGQDRRPASLLRGQAARRSSPASAPLGDFVVVHEPIVGRRRDSTR